MKKKKDKNHKHPIDKKSLSIAQLSSDLIARFVGSWSFILLFIFVIIAWIILNGFILITYYNKPSFDPFPFILLNLALSITASLQGPIILMSQNRQAERDRLMAKYDYQVNRKAEREVAKMLKLLNEIEYMVRNSKITPPHQEFKDYAVFKKYRTELSKFKTLGIKNANLQKIKHFLAMHYAQNKPIKMKDPQIK